MPPSELVHLETGELVRSFDDPVASMTVADGGPIIATVPPADAAHLAAAQAPDGPVDIEVTLHFLDPSGALRASTTFPLEVVETCCLDISADGDRAVVWTAGEPFTVAMDGTVGSAAEVATAEWFDPVTGLLYDSTFPELRVTTPDGASIELIGSAPMVLARYDDLAVAATEREVVGVRLVRDGP
jgi:hypothetical protein